MIQRQSQIVDKRRYQSEDIDDSSLHSSQDLESQQKQIERQLKEIEDKLKAQYKPYIFTLSQDSISATLTIVILLKTANERKYKVNFKMQVKSKLLSISYVNFKIEPARLLDISEVLSLKLEECMSHNVVNENDIQQVSALLEDKILQELIDVHKQLSLNAPLNSSKQSTSSQFDQSMIHRDSIPYPILSLSCWSSLGHLLTVHNTSTHAQKLVRDQGKDLKGRVEVTQFVYSRDKKNQHEQKDVMKNSLMIHEQDEEQVNAFMQVGMKIISETKEDDYDYLNYQFESLALPNLYSHHLNTPKYQNESNNEVGSNQNIYDFIDLSEKLVLSEQFKNLTMKVENLEQQIAVNQTIQINIYDFSSYSYSIINQIPKLHEYFARLLHRNNQPIGEIQLLFDAGLAEYLNIYKSELPEFICKSNSSQEQTQATMNLLNILVNNTHQMMQQNITRMNLLHHYLQYSKQCWDTQWNICNVFDQLIQILLSADGLTDITEVLYQLRNNKFENKLGDRKLFQSLINILPKSPPESEGIQVAESQVNEIHVLTQTGNSKLQSRIRQFNDLAFQKYQVHTTVKLKSKVTLPFITMKQHVINMQVLDNALNVQSVQQYALFKKMQQKTYQLQHFVHTDLNPAIKQLNGGFLFNIVKEQNNHKVPNQNTPLYCSVCQLDIVSGQVVLCNVCHHGGHYSHIMSWFEKQKYCPVCFDCECRNASYI